MPEDGGMDGSEADGAVTDAGPRAAHNAHCHALCTHEADCDDDCDLDEEPNCTPEKKHEIVFNICNDECKDGYVTRPEACSRATAAFDACAKDGQCGDQCFHDERDYLEQCVFQPGFLVCENLCSELEAGCVPYESLGVRSPGCRDTCLAAAVDNDCLTALYDFDECSPDMAYGCVPTSNKCLAKAGDVAIKCQGFGATTLKEDEVQLCEALAEEQCRCGLWMDVDQCELRAQRRCIYSLGRGDTCATAMTDFHVCMKGIDECDRTALLDQCQASWTAYNAACD